jgi:hypothetical protein
MTNETLRMQMLSGVITESEYKSKLQENKKKKSLKESMIGGIVGIGAINQIPPREKTDYETAFEHFLGERYETKFENREQDPYTMKEEYTVDAMEDEVDSEVTEEGKEVEEPSLYEDNPLEGGPGHMTKHRIGVISTLISDAEKDLIKYKESSFFTPELIEKMKGTIERLKSTLEDLKAQYEEELDAFSSNLDESEKPGTAKERSVMAKKARAGKDIGAKGKNFEKIAKSAAKEYGSEEAGKKVAGAVMYGKLNK